MNKQLLGISVGVALQTASLLAATSTFAAPKHTIDESTCGIVSGQLIGGVKSLGPWDYNKRSTHVHWERVQKSYFPPSVENLSRDPVNDALGAQKTLRIYPNHHRALYTLMKYYRDYSHIDNNGELYSMDCLFKRAKFFVPDDPMVHMLHGMVFHWNSDLVSSEVEYRRAYALKPGDAQINYNLGLLYFDKGEYETAAKHARIAYDAGYPLLGLRNKLKKVDVPLR